MSSDGFLMSAVLFVGILWCSCKLPCMTWLLLNSTGTWWHCQYIYIHIVCTHDGINQACIGGPDVHPQNSPEFCSWFTFLASGHVILDLTVDRIQLSHKHQHQSTSSWSGIVIQLGEKKTSWWSLWLYITYLLCILTKGCKFRRIQSWSEDARNFQNV